MHENKADICVIFSLSTEWLTPYVLRDHTFCHSPCGWLYISADHVCDRAIEAGKWLFSLSFVFSASQPEDAKPESQWTYSNPQLGPQRYHI